jgi:hypothetical protein
MTEADWNACVNPDRMLEWLRDNKPGQRRGLLRWFRRGSWVENNCRLIRFGCAAGRRWAFFMRWAGGRQLLDVAERFAEGRASQADLRKAAAKALGIFDPGRFLRPGVPEAWAWAFVASWAARAAEEAPAPAAERRAQADLIRCVFGWPLRPLHEGPAVPQTLVVTALARSIYEQDDFDALEEAGCADARLLAHLRGPTPHARGCWALDRVLGRE